MSEIFQQGAKVRTQIAGTECVVGRFLGGGGQGEVYEASWNGGLYALKWYFPASATDSQRTALKKLLKEHPAPSEQFLWPLDLCLSDDVPDFGYLMRLRESRFRGLLDLVTNRTKPSFCALVTAGLRFANNFYKLHAQGLCYRDIAFGNVFFDPDTGDVAICDNDNVTENRTPHTETLGTPDFMAPEIVRGEAVPSFQTDLYSLAVLLFYMFHIQHPLYGKKLLKVHNWDLKAREKLLGLEPVFIFDPQDHSNEAVDKSEDPLGEAGANALVFWRIYPGILRRTFTRAFTNGIRDPENGRVTEGEWQRVLSQVRDSIYFCLHCAAENFHDGDAHAEGTTEMARCWSCRQTLRLPFRLQTKKSLIMLHHKAKVYSHHIDDAAGVYDFDRAIGEVVQSPHDANVWGLKNVSPSKWVASLADGAHKDIEPGKSVVLRSGTKVLFGKTTGEIRY